MTGYELTIAPLYEAFRDEKTLRRLHSTQRQRVQERAIHRGERPDGGRLSIDDPIRRVKATFDPFWKTPIEAGIGERGYMCEDLVEACVISNPASVYGALGVYEAQSEIPWGPEGEGWSSAFDWRIQSNVPVSCKSSMTKTIEKLKPSSANLAQERRMMALAGHHAGDQWHTWMVHPGTLEAVGPFVSVLEQHEIDAALIEAHAVVAAWQYFKPITDAAGGNLDALRKKLDKDPVWNDPAEWKRRFGLHSASGAFRLDRLDANGGVEKRVRLFAKAMRAKKEAEREYDLAKDLIRPHVEEQINLARMAGRNVSTVSAYADNIDFAIRSNGAFVPSERKEAG